MRLKIKLANKLNAAEFSLQPLMRPLTATIGDLAQKNAREKLKGRFGAKIARSVEIDLDGQTIYCSSYIGEHAHEGGTIRAKNGKNLAIPINQMARESGEWPREIPDLFAVNVGRKVFLAKESADGKNLDFWFVLKPQVYQDPRPWWPDDDEVLARAKQFLEDHYADR